ncbi:hypothetical protein ACT75_08795 [Aggregatibacter actinomycetemcomitans]|uniref:Uncharacterized protein n=2 Tax=Aggregatibacter actinomycetemcomitans TaxID=714 RepID=A0AAC8XZJ5_AGGAC|nr:hypothetical protein Aaphi23p10 [Haemophilus phage Aaphi23]AMQ94606.1 hypothetical protein ACT75_08795 [Aggregatibacter actinomycetemcomitans]PHO20832.1 hypothetical protein CQR80_04905 [Aggregatibacter actinomycetemcomitans]PHO22979.1 hypothetical protein CQR79_05425 [Aggregatibacter actinomycetemcomitans]CAD90786.1 hypothetical protein [Haemophilus phage Aaphi23]
MLNCWKNTSNRYPMKIEYYKPISGILAITAHTVIWYYDFLERFKKDELRDLMSDLFTSSITLIGFIFAVIAILVSITEHSLIKKMRDNGMYQEILIHLKYLLIGFSFTSVLSYAGSLLSGELLSYTLLITSTVFMYNLLMLTTDMFRRLTLTFINLK